jgi:hypothetical protein
MFPSLRAPLCVAALAAALFAACTSSPEDDPFDTPPGTTLLYSDTVHVARAWGVCQNNTTRYVAYWGLRYLDAGNDTNSFRWLGVSVSASTVTASTWAVGSNTDADDAESPAGKASVLIFGAAGSQASAAARIRVTPFANGDSVRVEGKNILLQNGKVIHFNLVNGAGCA